ncbi:hypothetical protein FQA39_LY13083 [Lamprigera yunnana]|nr:hypothetical protein FQA39_LY13083 [Lamprigera yunnana]
MLFLTVFVFLFAGIDGTPVNLCSSTSGITLDLFNINNCTSSTCVVNEGATLGILLGGTANVDINTLKLKYTAVYVFATVIDEVLDVGDLIDVPLPAHSSFIYETQYALSDMAFYGDYVVTVQLINEIDVILLCFKFVIRIQ